MEYYISRCLPFSEYEGVTAILEWINEDNIEYARIKSPSPWYRKMEVFKYNIMIYRSTMIISRLPMD